MIDDQNYTQETFELEDTPQGAVPKDSSEEESVNDAATQNDTQGETQTDTQTEIQTDTQAETQTGQEIPDNWKTRASYFQSEAYKLQNVIKEQGEQIKQLLEVQKPKEEKIMPPTRPNTDDPTELLNYNIQMNEYLMNQFNQMNQERQQELERQRTYEQQIAARNNSISKLTEATKNPQKSQKIYEFFADTNNLNDPVIYNVMYDAAMAYRSGRPSDSPKKPAPPPPSGGDNLQSKKTPDDQFNEQLGQQDRYRL